MAYLLLPLTILRKISRYLAALVVVFLILILAVAQVNPGVQSHLNSLARNVGISLVAQNLSATVDAANVELKRREKKISELSQRNQQSEKRMASYERKEKAALLRHRNAKKEVASLADRSRTKSTWKVVKAGAGEAAGFVPIVGDVVSIGAASAAAYDTCLIFREIRDIGNRYAVPVDFYTDTNCSDFVEAVEVSKQNALEVRTTTSETIDVISISAKDRYDSTVESVSVGYEALVKSINNLMDVL
ncbi:MAG: hypothetical protein ABJ308_10180 [Halieaceae bacterium]